MKATAIAPANIAFLKYWGRTNTEFRLPANASFSMNLSEAKTTTTVSFEKDYSTDDISMEGSVLSQKEKERVVIHLDRIRQIAKDTRRAKVVTRNSFPKSCGIASSASGFAALTMAAQAALGMTLSERELSILARLGSGSAARSIPDGFVVWEYGDTSDESFAHSVFSPSHWDLRDIVVLSETKKTVSSTSGQDAVDTSPLYKTRLSRVKSRLSRMLEAVSLRDIAVFGSLLEEDCLEMHSVMQTQTPPLYYWTEETKHVMKEVLRMRKEGVPAYFTIDAGSAVHVICEGAMVESVLDRLGEVRCIINAPAEGARLSTNHLFL